MPKIFKLFSSPLCVVSILMMLWSWAGLGQELHAALGPGVAEYSSSSAAAGEGGDGGLPEAPAAEVRTVPRSRSLYLNTVRGPFSTVALAMTSGTLGIGAQVATPVSMRLNLRVGGTFFSYHSPVYEDSGVSYSGTLRLQSAHALVDWFPFGGGFHISPGLQLYNGFGGSAKVYVPAGLGLTLNHTDYLSDGSSPITGSGTLRANRVAPMVLVGFGNLIPRTGRHVSFPVEAGVAYQGSPKINFNLAGSACDANGENCQPVAGYTQLQRDLTIQQGTINSDARPYRFFPIVSFGFGYRF